MFETRSHYAALAGLEFTLQTRLAFNSEFFSQVLELKAYTIMPSLYCYYCLIFIHMIDCIYSFPSLKYPQIFLSSFSEEFCAVQVTDRPLWILLQSDR